MKTTTVAPSNQYLSPLELFRYNSKKGAYNFAARAILQTESLDTLKGISKIALPKSKRLFLFEEVVNEKEKRIHTLIADLAPTVFAPFKDGLQDDFTPLPTSYPDGIGLYGDWCDGKRKFASYQEWIALCNFAESIGDWSIADLFLQTALEGPLLSVDKSCKKLFSDFLHKNRIGPAVISQLAVRCIEIKSNKIRELPAPLRNLIYIIKKLTPLKITSDNPLTTATLFPKVNSLSCPMNAISPLQEKTLGYLFASLKKLRSLTLWPQQSNENLLIDRIAGVKNNLRSLKVQGQILSLNSKNFSGLTSLQIDNCSTMKASSFKEITNLNLKTLKLNRNNTLTGESLELLSRLTNLRILALRAFYFFGSKTKRGLKSLQKLEILDLSHSNVSAFAFLKEMHALTTVYLTGNLHVKKNDLTRLLGIKKLTYINLSFCPNLTEEDVSRFPQDVVVSDKNLGSACKGITSYNFWLCNQPLPRDVEDNAHAMQIANLFNTPRAKGMFQELFYRALEDGKINAADNKAFFQNIFKDPDTSSYTATLCLRKLFRYYDKEIHKTRDDFLKSETADKSHQTLFECAKMLGALESVCIDYHNLRELPHTEIKAHFINMLFPNHRIKKLTPTRTSDLQLSIGHLNFHHFRTFLDMDLNNICGAALTTLTAQKVLKNTSCEKLIAIAKKAPHLHTIQFKSDKRELFTLNGLKELKTLNSLELSLFKLGPKAIEEISSLSGLKKLSLIDCDYDLKELDLSALSFLEEFSLNKTPSLKADQLNFLRGHPTLTSLDVSGCSNLDDTFFNLVLTIPYLKTLHIKGCNKLSTAIQDTLNSRYS